MKVPRSFINQHGFSILEMLVAVSILSLLMVMIFQVTNLAGAIWKKTSAKIEAYSGARAGFESMAKRLSQATLNTYYDYYDSERRAALDPAYNGTPEIYGRKSELQFVSGKGLFPGYQLTDAVFFQAPLGITSNTASYGGLENLLNAFGFWVGYTKEERPPFFASSGLPSGPFRFRLMEYRQETENLKIFDKGTPINQTGLGWLVKPTAASLAPSRPLADDILALLIIPRKSSELPELTTLAPDFEYNSRVAWTSGKQPAMMHQLPPVVHLVMVAAEETNMERVLKNVTDSSAATTALGFSHSQMFKRTTDMDFDLSTLQKALAERGIGSRVFRTDVAMRGAKWSE